MSDAVAAQMNQSYTYFGFSACSAPKVSDNLSRPLLPQVTQMMSCQIQRKPFNGQLSLTLTRTLTMIDCIPSIAVCMSLCVCVCVCLSITTFDLCLRRTDPLCMAASHFVLGYDVSGDSGQRQRSDGRESMTRCC